MVDLIEGLLDILSSVVSAFATAIDMVSNGVSAIMSAAPVLPALWNILPGGYTGFFVGCLSVTFFVLALNRLFTH